MQAFCADLTASQTALLPGLGRKTVNRRFGLFRRAIAAHQAAQKVLCVGVVEVDESCFGASRPRGMPGKLKRGRGTLKQPVFGVSERGGRLFTEIIPDTNKPTLQRLIRGRIALEATVVPDGWRGCDGLVDVGCDRHLRIKKARPKQFSDNGMHISGIESFRSFTKRRRAKFNGVSKNFELHLKECAWRWAKNNDTLN